MMNQFQFDSALFPFNWVAWYREGSPPSAPAGPGQGSWGARAEALAKRKLEEGEDCRGPRAGTHRWKATRRPAGA